MLSHQGHLCPWLHAAHIFLAPPFLVHFTFTSISSMCKTFLNLTSCIVCCMWKAQVPAKILLFHWGFSQSSQLRLHSWSWGFCNLVSIWPLVFNAFQDFCCPSEDHWSSNGHNGIQNNYCSEIVVQLSGDVRSYLLSVVMVVMVWVIISTLCQLYTVHTLVIDYQSVYFWSNGLLFSDNTLLDKWDIFRIGVSVSCQM